MTGVEGQRLTQFFSADTTTVYILYTSAHTHTHASLYVEAHIFGGIFFIFGSE